MSGTGSVENGESRAQEERQTEKSRKGTPVMQGAMTTGGNDSPPDIYSRGSRAAGAMASIELGYARTLEK